MLLRIARRALAPSGVLLARQGAAPCALAQPSPAGLATVPEEPETCPPDEKRDFQGFVDLYLGGVWNRLEAEMRRKGGEGMEYEVNIERGVMSVLLPEGGRFHIEKDADHCGLSVRSNMHDSSVGAAEGVTEVWFGLEDGEFKRGGQTLHDYLEDGIAKHLKMQVDLEPPIDRSYGPDPT